MLHRKLAARDVPVRVGVIGAGIFGSQVIYAVENAPGMRVVAIADVTVSKARRAFERAGVDGHPERCESSAEVDVVVDDGGRAVLSDGRELVTADVDVVVEATGVPHVAARHAYDAILSGTDVVNVSVEADTVVGPLLSTLADRTGTTYSMAYGDQPAKVVELYDWARTNGFDVVAVGRTSGTPDYHGTPDDALERYSWSEDAVADLDPNPRMYNSFMDGTKVAVESCAIANALGVRPDTRGMHHPRVAVADAPGVLRPSAEGGVLERTGVIDCLDPTDDDFSGFVVTKTDTEAQRAYLSARDSVPTAGNGTYQLFHVPFHDAQETAVSVAKVALDGEPTGVVETQATEVVAAAKRDLRPGDELDGGGGSTVYGILVDAADAAEHGFVPFELLSGADVVSAVETDEILTEDDVALDTESFLYRLRKLQE